MTCSVVSVFELLAGCRNLREQRATLRSLATVEIVQVESGDSIQALQWYRSYHLSEALGSSIALSRRQPAVWIAKFTQ